jgi:hypothetical protein
MTWTESRHWRDYRKAWEFHSHVWSCQYLSLNLLDMEQKFYLVCILYCFFNSSGPTVCGGGLLLSFIGTGLSTAGCKCGCVWLVSAVKVPCLEEMPTPSDFINWLRYLEKKRIQLLQLASDQQFILTRLCAKKNLSMPVELFPLYDVLEHRYFHEDR